MREDTRSLWEQYDSEVEPWRRGRAFLICFGTLTAISDLFACAAFILSGQIETLFIFAAIRTVFWIQFYFIWIGVHWVRWLQGAFNMAHGFVLFFWSLQNESGAVMTFGMFMMGAGIASPFALTGAVSVNPHAIGAASGLYGFVQMSYGALCTVVVESWNPGSVVTVGVVMLASAIAGQIALSLAMRQ